MTGDALPKVVRPGLALRLAGSELLGGKQGAVAALLALGVGLYMSLGSRNFCLDDAWIHLAYAKSLRLGDGFAYNPGDHETGFSSPLWAASIALTPFLFNPVLAVKVLGTLCHAALAWGGARLTLLLSAAETAERNAWIAGGFVAIDPLLAFAAGSGMEVSLTAALVLWTVCVVLRGSGVPTALTLGFACVWARPETLFVLAPFCALTWSRSRSRVAVAAVAGALLALALWMVYCQVVSGHVWPNTYYAKRHAEPLRGLLYFGLRVVPAQSWAIGLTGFWLGFRAFAKPGPARALALAWLCAILAIACSREIVFGSLFYCTRYFAIFGAIPCVLAASQLRPRLRSAMFGTVPIFLASALMLPQARALQRAQEEDITAQHTQPAQYLARELPADARLAVEGAGATRFFLPRTMHVIDVVGLNYAAAVHANTSTERTCSVVHAHPTHVLLPSGFFEAFERSFVLEPIQTFVDETSALTVRSSVHRIHAARVLAIQPEVRRMCGIDPAAWRP
jgi:hypothetical protein